MIWQTMLARCTPAKKLDATLSDSASRNRSHDLVLSEATGYLRLHGVCRSCEVGVLDERESERATAVLVASELGCCAC